MKAIVVAGTHSGCGKTTVSLGLMYALKEKGSVVQGFKVGPDYIDQGLHAVITQRPSRNLDPWMMGEEGVRLCFCKNTLGCDVAVVEGVMGIFDGEYGTWKVAKILGLPVLLVMDAYGTIETIGPLAKGIFEECQRREIELMGVVLTRVGSNRHLERLRGSLPVRFLGHLPRDGAIKIPSRHLGLYVAEEAPLKEEALQRLGEYVLQNLDLEEILKASEVELSCDGVSRPRFAPPKKGVALIARDRAFCFYYQENLDAMVQLGYELQYFSPLLDEGVPMCQLVYLGGGYPELYGKELSQNKRMLNSLRELALDGIPIYAECGGLMYLSQGLLQEREFIKLVGVFPFSVRMKSKVTLGYREISLKENFLFLEKGQSIRGHEFHYSEIIGSGIKSKVKRIFEVFDQDGTFLLDEGFRISNVLATYMHNYFGSQIIERR